MFYNINPRLFSFIYSILLFLSFSSFKLHAQINPENTKFKHLSVDDGLSDNNVFSIIQDKEGFMWLGTSDGLNKYDGYNFTIYRHNPSDTNSIGPGNITCIYEDREGLLWIGTSGSLSVLNKKTGKFKVYKNDSENPNSLSYDLVNNIIEDKEGTMWICTYGGGLNKFNKRTEKFKVYKNDPADPNSIRCDYLENCFEDSNGSIWIATFGQNGQKGGLSSFDKKSEKFTHYSDNNGYSGMSVLLCQIVEDSKGLIWAGNGTYVHGLTAFDKEKKACVKQYKNNPKDKYSLSSNVVLSLYDDAKGYFWTGTNNGLNVLDKNTGKFTVFKNDLNNPNSLSHNRIARIYRDNQGLIWIGTEGGGVNIYDSFNNSFSVFKNNSKNIKSLNNNQIYSIYEDSEGSVWLGTGAAGLTNFDKTTGEFNFFKGELISEGKKTSLNVINSIQEVDEQKLWIGMSSNQLAYFDRITNKFGRPPSPFWGSDGSPGFIIDLLTDSKKNLWVTTPNGLFSFFPADKKRNCFLNDPKNPATVSENYTITLLEDSKSNIWVSTFSTGLNVFERSSNKFFCFKNNPKDPNSINNNTVYAMYEAPNGVLWIGTNGGGIDALVLQEGKDKFTSGYKFYHFTDKDGLPNNVINKIIADNNGNLWIGTNSGSCRFTPPDHLSLSVKAYLTKVIHNDIVINDKPVFKNYDVNDGLPSNSITVGCKTKDGLIYFGSMGGLVCFNPDSIKDNMHKPPVHFTSFRVFEKEFPLDTPLSSKKKIILSYKESFFSFEFVALDYAQPSKNQYAFMMEGFDNKWIYIGNRRYASYTNLDPGEYVFRVKACNNSGVWNEDGTSIRIIITPPFWRTKIFYILCLLFFVTGIFSYIKWRERRLRAEKIILEEQVASRTKALKEANAEITQKNVQITDSINYAKRIQQAILPDKNEIYAALPQCFILYKPKDIVSGDFYFFHPSPALPAEEKVFSQKELTISPAGVVGGGCIIAVADCTGHGVPGAFMSMISSEKLHETVQQSKQPGEILMLVNKGIKTTLHQSDNDESTRDGMDVALCRLSPTLSPNGEGGCILHYAGANRPLWITRKNPLYKGEGAEMGVEEIKPTKHAIGGFTKSDQYFETHEIQLQQGDTFYIFTDGYADQFGGEDLPDGKTGGKKFTTKKLKQLLIDIQHKSMPEQEKHLNTVINTWSLNREQVDDILVIGVRV